jgi:hypothetical protein
MSLWIKNTDGERDAVLTMALLGFIIVLVKVLLAGVVLTWSETRTFTFGTIDAATIAAVLAPTLGAYVARRYTDAKFDQTTTAETMEKIAQKVVDKTSSDGK